MDSTDANVSEKSSNEAPSNDDDVDPSEFKKPQTFFVSVLQAQMPVEREAVYYNMTHSKRGIAIILNHEFFLDNLKPRSGAMLDHQKMKDTLDRLGFDTWSRYNLTEKEIADVIREAAQLTDHTDHDALVVVVMTHGDPSTLHAKDKSYKPEKLWQPFTADKCKTLAGKPKLFFIQACQCDTTDSALMSDSTDSAGMSDTTNSASAVGYKIPIQADFLIAFSTIPASCGDVSRGSLFIQALCVELDENAFRLDLLTILALVNNHLAAAFQSYKPDNQSADQKMQVPCLTNMLTRRVMFTRKPRIPPNLNRSLFTGLGASTSLCHLN